MFLNFDVHQNLNFITYGLVLNRMVRKRFNAETTPAKSNKVVDKIFEIANAQDSNTMSTPDQRTNYRLSRYDTAYTFEGRYSTPLEHNKRRSLDPTYNSPYNQYSFSSSEAGWKLRMKAAEHTVTPFDPKSSADKRSSISPVRLKDDLINIESIKKEMKERQQNNKSTGKINTASKAELRSERQLSDPKKLLDEFMLPHATVMA